MAHPILVLLHLLGFAAFLGGAFAQQQLLRTSSNPALSPAARDERERLASVASTKVELPGLFAQVATGVIMLVLTPDFLRQHWMHAKLTVVVLLLVLGHVEMINARRIVRARAERGDAAATEIAARKRRHAALGTVGTALVVALLLLVTVLRGAF